MTEIDDVLYETSAFKIVQSADGPMVQATDYSVLEFLAQVTGRKEDDNQNPPVLLADLLKEPRKTYNIARKINDPDVYDLYRMVLQHDPVSVQEAQGRIARGVVTFNDLFLFFPIGSEILAFHDDMPVGGVLQRIAIIERQEGVFARFNIQILHNMADTARLDLFTAYIAEFSGTLPVAELPIRHVTPNEKEGLTARGLEISPLTNGMFHKAHAGVMLTYNAHGRNMMSATGRVMIDPVNFHKNAPQIWQQLREATPISFASNVPVEAIDAGNAWMCWPFVYGFSFSAKRWGRFCTDNISPIVFKKDAFDRLVMATAQKKMIKALVSAQEHGFTDLIDGKGGGLIFLLHGQPGLGKTLTAEAVAELLERPLYTVGVGELGVSPDTLDERLQNILNVAADWDALVLLDEADIFIEARDRSDVQRNAMVGIFLRQLEYYSGVLFLTTNRVKNFDPAVYSRISMALSFQDFQSIGDSRDAAVNRALVWESLAGAAGVTFEPSELKILAKHPLNARQIKNTLNIGLRLAIHGNEPLTVSHFETAIAHTLNFLDKVRPSFWTKVKKWWAA